MDRFNFNRASILTYMGVLPFWIGLVSILWGYEKSFSAFAVSAYAAIIISFISGIHWAIGMKNARQSSWLFVASNVFALLAWSSLLIHKIEVTLIIEIACFVFLHVVDTLLLKDGKIDLRFVKLRRRATLLVVVALLVTLAVAS